VDVEPEDALEALETGEFYHPERGVKVEDFRDHLLIHYKASELLKKILTWDQEMVEL